MSKLFSSTQTKNLFFFLRFARNKNGLKFLSVSKLGFQNHVLKSIEFAKTSSGDIMVLENGKMDYVHDSHPPVVFSSPTS